MDESRTSPHSPSSSPQSEARTSASQVQPGNAEAFREEMVALTRQTLLQRGQMWEIRERIREVGERLSKLTPPQEGA